MNLQTILDFLRAPFPKRLPASVSLTDQTTLKAWENRSLAVFILIFVLFATGLAAIGYFTYRRYESQYRAQLDEQLTAIALLKVNRLESWRSERMGDANIFYKNPVFAAVVQTFLENPGGAQAAVQLQAWLDAVHTGEGYDRVFLLDAAGVERMASPATPQAVGSILTRQAAATLGQGQVTFMDFYRDRPSGPIHLALLIPIYAEGAHDYPLGVLVLSINPAASLYPFIHEWPAPGNTAETLLVRRDGNDVLYLNDLRFQPNTALGLRIPLERTNMLAVKAVLGQSGIVEGVDYRGQSVIGYVCAVPDSPWFLVARIDIAEVYAPLQARLWQTILFFGILILVGGVGLSLLRRQQGLRYYQAQVEAAERVTASEVRYRRLFEAARDGILILDAETGVVLDVNPLLVEMLGFPQEGIVGKQLWELGFFKDIAANKANFLELQQKGYIRYENLPLETMYGRRLYVEFVSNVYQVDHQRVVQCNIRDITERRRSQEVLETRLRLVDFSAHHALAELLQQTLDEVCTITDSPIGFYHFVEPDQETFSLQAWSTRTLQEYCKAEGTGRHYNLDEAGVWADCLRERRPIIHNDYVALPHRKGLPEGHAALTRELLVPIFRDNLVVAILGIGNRAQDYTEKDIETVTFFADVAWELVRRKRAEQELQTYSEHLMEMVDERTRDLRQAQEKLVRQERLATLGQLAGSVGHELRNPLGVISNAVYFLKLTQPDASDTAREYLDIIEKETRTSAKIVTDLLDFTRIKSVEREAADVSVLLGQTLQRCPVPAPLEVVLEIPPDLPPVYADPQHVVQVLGNLVTNACQAMEDSPGANGAPAARKLTLSASLRDDMVAIAVQDTGAGIPPENMDKLFEPLFTTKTKGIGLGLAVSQRLAEANGGRIEARSQLGQGSTFTVYLPVYKEENGNKTSHPDRR